jgi:hypothetical protein
MKWRLSAIVAVVILVLSVEGFLAWLFLRIGLGQSDQVASVLGLLLAVVTAAATVAGTLRQRERGTAAHATPTPAQLDATTRYFTGRAAEVARLGRQLRRSATAPTVVLISGTAGVGKTALAMHWAHRTRAHFPDGQLHVNLQGYHPDQAYRPGTPWRSSSPVSASRAHRFRRASTSAPPSTAAWSPAVGCSSYSTTRPPPTRSVRCFPAPGRAWS